MKLSYVFWLGFAIACGPAEAPPTSPKVEVAGANEEVTVPEPVVDTAPREYGENWRGFGVPKCAYLAPVDPRDFIAADGAVDVVYHFHAGQMSEREIRASGVRGVFVSCGYGIGTGGYSKAFEDPRRFGWMLKQLMRTVARDTAKAKMGSKGAPPRELHLGHLALTSWSAGFASVSRILSVPQWYEATDTVVLLDGMHAQYRAPTPHTPGQGADRVDVKMLRQFVRFANDAAHGKAKTMVITHSSIVPPDYASTAESTAALMAEIGVSPSPAATTDAWADGPMGPPVVVADMGGFHVRGYRGTGPRDHFDHLHRIGDALRSWLVPRWYTPGQ